MMETVMTTSQSSTTDERSPGRDVLSAARFYLVNRWTLLALGSGLAVGLGLYLGGWGWLVAIGAAPIILSTLPCLIMCGLGVCFMCRPGNKESASPSIDAATSSSALGIVKPDAPLVVGLSCCQGASNENPANALTEDSTDKWKEETHA
jgi:hypothetical protein